MISILSDKNIFIYVIHSTLYFICNSIVNVFKDAFGHYLYNEEAVIECAGF